MLGLAKRFKVPSAFDTHHRPDGYQLLPARFIALDGTRYVLTNDAGEFIVLHRADLVRYIKKELRPEESLYDDLRAKHFLMDGDSAAALDLLPLKIRTKAQRVAQFTSLHMFVVTLRCDYTCKYCQVSRQTDDQVAFDMSEETADRAVDFVFKSPSRAVKIEFQGGESLLNFPIIERIVLRAEELNKLERRDLAFVIATNLTPLTDDILSFCRTHRIYISTSLDGPAALHNKNRPRPGKNGHSLTVNGIERARAALGRDYVSALMTTTYAGLDAVRETIDAYLELEFDGIFLRPLSPYGFAVRTGQTNKYDAEKWFQFYVEGLSYILEINKRGYVFVERYTQLILTRMFSPISTAYVDLQSPAGIGIAGIVYNYDGAVFASDEARMLQEMGDSTFRLGHLNTDTYEDIITSDALLGPLEASVLESVPMCTDCGFLPYCGSDPVYHHATQRDAVGHKAFSGFCTKNMSIMRHIMLLLEDDPDAKRILMSWVRA